VAALQAAFEIQPLEWRAILARQTANETRAVCWRASRRSAGAGQRLSADGDYGDGCL